MAFCWTTIKVTNMENSLKFYRDVVGLPISHQISQGEERQIIFLGDGSTKVELIFNKGADKVSFGEDISLGFEVTSLEEKITSMKEHGIQIHSGPFQPNPKVRFFYVTDPDGLKIQFVENL